MLKFRAVLVICLLLISNSNAYALESRSFVLDNGLETVMVREPKAPVVVTQVWYKAGASDEVDGKTGLAHMLEHMMFQGTKRHGPSEFSKIIAKNGGEDNASTSQDYTNYWIKLSSDRLELALDLEADRMQNLILQESEFISENMVVQEERRSRTDNNPKARFFEKFRKAILTEHPYGRPVIGWMDEIKAHTLADLKAWYKRYYAPNNAVLVVVGDIDFTQTEKLVKKYFAPLKRGDATPRTPLPDFPERHETLRLDHQDEQTTLPMLYAGFPVPTFMMGDEEVADAFALEVLSTILGGSSSSRIYRQMVVKDAMAVSAGSGYGGLSRGVELFSLSAVPRPEFDLQQMEEALFAEIAKLKSQLVGKRELQRAKNGLISNHLFAQDSIDRIAWLIGRARTNDTDWKFLIEGYPERIQAVTAEEVRDVAIRYLKKERAAIGTLTP